MNILHHGHHFWKTHCYQTSVVSPNNVSCNRTQIFKAELSATLSRGAGRAGRLETFDWAVAASCDAEKCSKISAKAEASLARQGKKAGKCSIYR